MSKERIVFMCSNLGSCFVRLRKFVKLLRDIFQMCMHGGGRDKTTLLWYSGFESMEPLGLLCDGKHQHLPWHRCKEVGEVYATAQERCYPALFCQRLAEQVRVALRLPKKQKPLAASSLKFNGEQQPRRGIQELIPEFKFTEHMEVPAGGRISLNEGD